MNIKKVLKFLNYYAVFFLIISFVITCCVMLFVQVMTNTMDITLRDTDIAPAAKLTFVNVIFLSLVCTLIDALRRKKTVSVPIDRITDAANRITNGDYSVRIAPLEHIDYYGLNRVIDCFNHMANELSGTETLRTDFIANVSHELKTPLSVIKNYGALLQQPGLTDKQRLEYSKAITDSSKRLADLITNILKLNKLENQQIFPAFEKYDLSDQLCEALIAYEDIWENKGLEIETEIADCVNICADAELMALVWNNLFSNAFKFTDKGKVTVTLTTEEGYAVVRISDTGCGMTPEVGARIFEKFYQGDSSHSTQGNGLGLALVKRVVDIMKAEINVESVHGKGSTFTVKISLC